MISCILLAISVSIDALTLGITYGIKHSRITKISNLIVFSIAFVSTSIAIFLGKHISKLFSPFVATIIGSALLILLGIYSASILNIVSLIRNIVYFKSDNKKSTYFILLLTLIVGIICAIYDSRNYILIISIMPLIINLLYAYILNQKDIVKIKKVFLFCSIVWIVYDFFVKAYVGLICNTLEMLSYVMYFVRRKKWELE